jgi:hypothetical protein
MNVQILCEFVCLSYCLDFLFLKDNNWPDHSFKMIKSNSDVFFFILEIVYGKDFCVCIKIRKKLPNFRIFIQFQEKLNNLKQLDSLNRKK